MTEPSCGSGHGSSMTDATQTTGETPEYGGDVIASHLVEAYGIKPFILPSGKVGMHFMELSSSQDSNTTLAAQIVFDIESSRNEDGRLDAEVIPDLRAWRETLKAALAIVEGALST